MTNNKRTTLIVLSAVAAGLLLLAQFIDWFQISALGMSAGFHAWSVNVNGFGASESTMWFEAIGKEGAEWQAYLMVLAGPLMLASTVMVGLAILPINQGRPDKAARLGMFAGIGSAAAIVFAFIANYSTDSDTKMDPFVGLFIAVAGCVVAFVASSMSRAATTGNVPGPTTPTETGMARPPGQ